VELRVYDVGGRRVRTLVDGVLAPDHYELEWDGRDDRGRAIAPGVYLYRLTAGDRSLAHRLVKLR
jgi:hypothetical protein